MSIARPLAALAAAALTVFIAFLSAQAAPASPYAGQEQREIKALSPEDVKALEAGEGMGLAKAAELNRYPGPRHVLDLATHLGLTDAQRAETERIYAGMHSEAVRLGHEILGLERELEQGFSGHTMKDTELSRLTAELGRLQGQLRASHLRAHLRMRALLNAEQVERYHRMRGYDGSPGPQGASSEPHSPRHTNHP